MELLAYETRPYFCMFVGGWSLTGSQIVLNVSGLVLVSLGFLIWKMRHDYRKEARRRA